MDVILDAEMKKQVESSLFEIVEMVSSAIELTTNGISQHGKIVAFISKQIYEACYKEQAPIILLLSAILHDIGTQDFNIRQDLHNLFPREEYLEKHSQDGFFLLQNVDLFKEISIIVGNHHRSYSQIDNFATQEQKLFANIINLADRIHISIREDKNILTQSDCIRKQIQLFKSDYFLPEIVDAFNTASTKAFFWLNITNKAYIHKLIHGQFSQKIRLRYADILQIADLCADLIDRKSPYTAAHSRNVSLAAARIGRIYQLDQEKCFLLSIAGKLHDLGKLSISEDLLHKTTVLEHDEMLIMHQHPYYSDHSLSMVAFFDHIKIWASYHHENLDGSGYPFGKKGDEIPFEARIISIADKIVALNEDRSYRKKKSKENILEILQSFAEKNWIDSSILKVVLAHYDTITKDFKH